MKVHQYREMMRYLTRPPAPTPSMQVAEVTRDESLEPPYEYKPEQSVTPEFRPSPKTIPVMPEILDSEMPDKPSMKEPLMLESGGLAESFPDLVEYLKSNEGKILNIRETAKKFNVSDDTVSRRIEEYGLDIKSGGRGGSLLIQTKLPKEELDIFNKGYKTKTISQMASEITGLPYSNKATKAKNAQLYRYLLSQQKLGNVLEKDVMKGVRPEGTTPKSLFGFTDYRKKQQDLMNLDPKTYKDMTPSKLDHQLRKLLQFEKVRGAFNVQPDLAPSFEHVQGVTPGSIVQDPEALKKVAITTKRYNFDILGSTAKNGIYKGIKNNLRTAREALKLGDKDQAKISLDLVNKAYDQVVKDYKTLNRDELPFYKIKGNDIREINVKGVTKQRTLKKSLFEYIKNVSAVADPEEIKQPNLRKAVNLIKKGKDAAAEKLIQSRVPAVKEGALFMHILPNQESIFDYLKSIGSDIKTGKILAPVMKVLAPVGVGLGIYGAEQMYEEGAPVVDALIEGGLGVPGPVRATAKYSWDKKNLTPDEKLAIQRRSLIQTIDAGEADPEFLTARKQLDPDFKDKSNQEYVDFLTDNKGNIFYEADQSDERFDKEVYEPFLEKKIETRKNILNVPIVQKIINPSFTPEEQQVMEFAMGGRVNFQEGSEERTEFSEIPPIKENKPAGGIYFGVLERRKPIVATSGGEKEAKEFLSSLMTDQKPAIGYGGDNFNVYAARSLNPYDRDKTMYEGIYNINPDSRFFVQKQGDYTGAGFEYDKENIKSGIRLLKDEMGRGIMFNIGAKFAKGGVVD